MSPRAAEYDLEDDDDEDEEKDDQEQQQQQREPKLSRSDLRALRQKAKNHDTMATKLAEMERNEAFRDAGINPKDPKAKYFVKGYDGELDPEKIKAEAIEAGLLEAPPETDAKEVESHQKMDGAAAGASPPGKVNPLDKVVASDPKTLDEFIKAAQGAGIPTSLDGND